MLLLLEIFLNVTKGKLKARSYAHFQYNYETKNCYYIQIFKQFHRPDPFFYWHKYLNWKETMAVTPFFLIKVFQNRFGYTSSALGLLSSISRLNS